MDVGSWCNFGCRNNGWSRTHSDNGSCCSGDRMVLLKVSSAGGSKVSIWRLLWRKIKREKKRLLFDCSSISSSSSSSVHFTYDPNSYAQNFDQGSFLDDHDDLSRSFSARFAVPSRVFERGVV